MSLCRIAHDVVEMPRFQHRYALRCHEVPRYETFSNFRSQEIIPVQSSRMPNATTARANVFADVERNGNGNDFSRVDTLSMDPAVFEKLFLNPQTAVKHDLANTFAIPTPLRVLRAANFA